MGVAIGVREVVIPPEISGWVLIGRGRRPDEFADAVSSLHRANIATLTIELPAGVGAATERIRAAADRMRHELAGGLPIGYLAADAGAGAGWAASLRGGLDAVIAWNGTPGGWRPLRHVQVPSLLVVDGPAHEVPWRLLLTRALSWRLGSADIELAHERPMLLADWYWDRVLSPPPVRRPRPRLVRVRLATMGLAAAAFTLPTVGAAALPDFASAARLSALEIGGDNLLARPLTDLNNTGSHRLTASQIDGDGPPAKKPDPTGSVQLVDGSGVRYFINNAITFSTSSSASAAMSEAGYTHAVAATTANGGTVASTLNDAYDGYESLCVANDNAVASCETGNANFTIYNKNGVSTLESNGRQADWNSQTINGLTVTRKVFVPSKDSFARWLDIVHNPGTSAKTVTFDIANNLGSDANTIIVNDSSGNTTPTTSDTWVTTFQNYSGSTSSDPRLGHVLGSKGAAVGLAGIHFANGNDNPFWGYTFTVPPGATRIIMNYGVVQPSKAAAAAKSAQLAEQNDAHQLDFMSAAEQAEVLNFAIPVSAVADTFSTKRNTAINQPAPGVLGNDPVASDLTAALVSGPSHAASFTLNPDGSFSYTPSPGFVGTDSFTYEAKGAGGGTSAPTTVTLNVNGAATFSSAATAAFTVGQGGSFTIRTSAFLTAKISEAPALPPGLRFVDNGDGTATITGTPAPGTHGRYSITLTATNTEGSATQTLTLVISPGPAPQALAQRYSAISGRLLTIPAPGVLTGASGEAPLHAVLVSGSTESATVSLAQSGAFTYRSKAGFVGTDTFRYAAADPDGGTSSAATVTLTVRPNPQLAQVIADTERRVGQILTSYNTIIRDTDQILHGVTNQTTVKNVRGRLHRAAVLAKQARRLKKKARNEGVTLGALDDVNVAGKKAAVARRLAAAARKIAAEARAGR